LNSINKKTTKQLQLEFMNNTRKAGLLVNGCFILGLPGDTKESMHKTIEFAKELNPDTAQFYPLMVYPGTESYRWAKEAGYLKTEDYSKWLTAEGLHNTVLSRPDLSEIELLEICEKARKSFYIRPKYVVGKTIQVLKSPREAKRIVKSSKVLVKHIIKT
jgi:radical SAM superfamily enzyme YgiQ (UPF0313 family)